MPKISLGIIFKPLHHPVELSYHGSRTELGVFYKGKVLFKAVWFFIEKIERRIHSVFFLFPLRKTSWVFGNHILQDKSGMCAFHTFSA